MTTLVPPEVWLREVEKSMKSALYAQLHKALKDRLAISTGEDGGTAELTAWIEKWPG